MEYFHFILSLIIILNRSVVQIIVGTRIVYSRNEFWK